ncbi:hypothetical protein Tco_1213283 [Tanacetum coccineum]
MNHLSNIDDLFGFGSKRCWKTVFLRAPIDDVMIEDKGVKILSLTPASPFLVAILLSRWYLIRVELSCA